MEACGSACAETRETAENGPHVCFSSGSPSVQPANAVTRGSSASVKRAVWASLLE